MIVHDNFLLQLLYSIFTLRNPWDWLMELFDSVEYSLGNTGLMYTNFIIDLLSITMKAVIWFYNFVKIKFSKIFPNL
jgi:hypothetical protein